MGEVYRARDTRLGREVALKVLPHAVAGDPERRARFEREARAVASLSHPNILAIHDYDTQGAVTYAVMELLHGETLRSRLANGPLSWREAVDAAAAVADGLAAAHARGVLHRDLKPENLFRVEDGRVKILDFGLARVIPTADSQAETGPAAMVNTAAGAVMGTAGYMSPEQIRGQAVGAASDLFSLGCVLHEMLTGRRTFNGETPAEIMTSILHDDPPDLTTSSKALPSGLDRIVRQCLEKDPARRFHSAHDLSLALRHLSDDSIVTGELAGVRRRPMVAGVAAIITSIVLLIAGAAWFQRTTSAPGRRPSAPIDSLAILPLVNGSGDPDMEFLGDGITEGLINRLSQLPGLRVMARTDGVSLQEPAGGGPSGGRPGSWRQGGAHRTREPTR